MPTTPAPFNIGNFSDTSPAAPAGKKNVNWQIDRTPVFPLPPLISANIPDFAVGIQDSAYDGGLDTGTANAYIVTLTPAPTIASLSVVKFKVAHTNTTASTLTIPGAVSGGSTTAIKKWSSGSLVNLAAGDWTAGQVVVVIHDGTIWQWVGGPGSGVTTVTASSPLASSGGATPNISLSSAVPLALGGTHADLSATGGAHQVVKQSSAGADLTVGQLDFSDLSGRIATSQAASAVNLQTGTSYTYLDTDRGKLVTHSNASAIAGTLPQAGASSLFIAGWFVWIQNRGAGTLTITPTTSTIDGASSLVLTTGQGVGLFSDGTNYYTMGGRGSPGSSATWINEAPSGTRNGMNVTFTLSHTPTSGSLDLTRNGVGQIVGTHFTISGGTITMTYAPDSTDTLYARYQY